MAGSKKLRFALKDTEGKILPWRFSDENKARDFKALMGRNNWEVIEL